MSFTGSLSLPQRPQSAGPGRTPSTGRPQSAGIGRPQSAGRVVQQRVRPQSAGTTYQASRADVAAQAERRLAERAENAVAAPVTKTLQSALSTSSEVDRIGGYKEQLLQAAIMQLAPKSQMLSCRLGTCCWRWAARRLLDECEHAQKNAHQLREAFYEELGDSVLQQLIQVQQDYDDLQVQMQASRETLEDQHHAAAALEARLVEQERKRMEAVAAEERAELETEEQRKKVAEMANGIWLLEGQLLELKNPKEKMEKIEARCRELEAIAEDAERRASKAIEELRMERLSRGELEVKLKQFAAYEEDNIKERSKARRTKKGGARKEGLRAGLPTKT